MVNSIGEKIKKARKGMRLTQADLGQQLGLAQQTVGSWEAGNSLPDPETIVKMCKCFNVSADWLLGLSDDPTPHTITAAQRAALEALPTDARLTDEQLAAKLPADVREGVLALLRIEREKHMNS